MELSKAALTSPSLRTRLPPLRAADNRAVAPLHARARLVHTQGVPTDTPASRCCSPATTHVAHAPDYPGSQRHSLAWCAASAAAAHAGTLSSRNTLDREPAGVAETPRRTRHIAAPPSTRPRPDNLSRVRYRPAVNGSVTNSRAVEKHR